jgi:hypothetical protein
VEEDRRGQGEGRVEDRPEMSVSRCSTGGPGSDGCVARQRWPGGAPARSDGR